MAARAKDIHVTIKTEGTLPDGHKVEIVRVDKELKAPLSAKVLAAVIARIEELAQNVQAIIISD